MLDYLSRINDIPLCEKYNQIRTQSLSRPVYPKDVLLAEKLDSKSRAKENSYRDAIPEFVRFNIVECNIRDVDWQETGAKDIFANISNKYPDIINRDNFDDVIAAAMKKK